MVALRLNMLAVRLLGLAFGVGALLASGPTLGPHAILLPEVLVVITGYITVLPYMWKLTSIG